jgi:hypothetical protein
LRAKKDKIQHSAPKMAAPSAVKTAHAEDGMHPSWAAKRMKEADGSSFQGTKIVFD